MLRSETRTPRFVSFLAYLLWSFPFTYIFVLGTFYNLPASTMAKIFFSFYYIVHSAFAIFLGFSLLRMRHYAWHLYLFHSFLVVVEQIAIAYGYAENHIPEIPLTLMCAGTAGLVLALKFELRVPYFSPKIAWWESDPRYKISVPAEMTCADHFYRGDIMDISSSGAFIKTKDPLRVDQVVVIKFSLFDHKFECEGRVVWRTETGVTHPKGVGVRFVNLDKPAQGELRETVKKLKSLSRRYKDLRKEEKATVMERKVATMLSQRKG